MKKRLAVLLFAGTGMLFAGDLISLAPYPWMTVGYSGNALVFNTSCDKLPYDDPFYHAQGDTTGFIKVMEYVPDAATGDLYSILFSMGESGDSQYLFFLEGEFRNPAFILHADHLTFSGDGLVIARGSTNQMFTRSRKFRIDRGKIREMPQPFYAVDLESQATRDFPVFESKKMKKILTEVHRGEALTVLAAEFKPEYRYYLIRTSLGLCGWIRVEREVWVDETPVKDLYYHGD